MRILLVMFFLVVTFLALKAWSQVPQDINWESISPFPQNTMFVLSNKSI